MPVIIPNGDFEGGGSWIFTGAAGRTGSPSLLPGITQTPHGGSTFAYINLINTLGRASGSMSVDFTVGAGQAGRYALQGWFAANHDPLHLFGDGADYFRVYLDGDIWIPIVNIYVSGYLTWVPFTSTPHDLTVGTHTLLFTPISEPFSDYTGTFYETWSSYALFDDISLQLIAPHQVLRLVHAAGSDTIRLRHRTGTGRVRLVHHA